jgi:hypothetical protein
MTVLIHGEQDLATDLNTSRWYGNEFLARV